MLFTLIIILILEFLLALFIYKNDILAPAVVFSFVFLLSTTDLILMSTFWDVSLQLITAVILISGIFLFIIGTYVANMIPSINIKFGSHSGIKYVDNLRLSGAFLNSMILIYIFFIAFFMIYVIRLRGGGVISTGLIDAYGAAIGGDTDLNLPVYVSLPYTFLLLAGYVWGYIFANNLVINRNIDKRCIVLFLLALILSISNGKRGEFIALTVSLIVYVLLALKKSKSRKSRKSRKLSRQIYLMIFILLILVALLFQHIATIMGRDSDRFGPFEYFSIYLGAPILNLNTSVIEKRFSHPVFLSETFHSLYTAIGENFAIKSFIYKTDRIFWSSPNGKRVGNVATTFYDFYHDGGMLGVIFLSFVMGVIIQYVYKGIKCERYKNKMFSTIVFSYMLWMIARSFFANSLFDWITLSTIITLAIWWIYSITIPKIGI